MVLKENIIARITAYQQFCKENPERADNDILALAPLLLAALEVEHVSIKPIFSMSKNPEFDNAQRVIIDTGPDVFNFHYRDDSAAVEINHDAYVMITPEVRKGIESVRKPYNSCLSDYMLYSKDVIRIPVDVFVKQMNSPKAVIDLNINDETLSAFCNAVSVIDVIDSGLFDSNQNVAIGALAFNGPARIMLPNAVAAYEHLTNTYADEKTYLKVIDTVIRNGLSIETPIVRRLMTILALYKAIDPAILKKDSPDWPKWEYYVNLVQANGL